MHSSSFDTEIAGKDGGEVLVAIAALVTEVRIPSEKAAKSKKGFYEGPHCPPNKSHHHQCDLTDVLCSTFGSVRDQVLDLWKKSIPVSLDVLLVCKCQANDAEIGDFLLEKWYFAVNHRRSAEPLSFNFVQLMHAIRSQLYFSQLTAWLSIQDGGTNTKISRQNLRYRLTLPGETLFESPQFMQNAIKHEFPLTDIGNGFSANVSFLSLPRMATMPKFECEKCAPPAKVADSGLFDDRMHTNCTLKGKHRCEDFEELENVNNRNKLTNFKRLCQSSGVPSTSKRNLLNSMRYNDLNAAAGPDQGKLLLDAIERSAFRRARRCDAKCVQSGAPNERDNGICDKILSESDISSIRLSKMMMMRNVGDDANNHCDSLIPLRCDDANRNRNDVVDKVMVRVGGARKKLTFDENEAKIEPGHDVPSASDKAKFRKNLDNAANMVFHSRTGLPLTSSPAPVRRGKSCFDFDSTINSVQAIKSALFSTSFLTDDESESDGSIVSPCSPETSVGVAKRDLSPVKYRRKGHASNLLGSFEESVLNGRLEPVSTVHGFTAELGASGSFVPKHLIVPVTVFFYTLGDNDKVSSPYLSHINLGKKGYNVPKSGTIQVTLFNPLGTVVKMFVIMYDLNDMPPTSQTFIRQRTFYMPTNLRDKNAEWGPKWLRYLIHLRFISSKSGKIYLHSDIRMIIFRKSDMDTATAHGIDVSYELRSFTHMPINPRFSPRK